MELPIIKHKCKKCADSSNWYADISKEYADRSKEYADRSKWFADSCLCEKKKGGCW